MLVRGFWVGVALVVAGGGGAAVPGAAVAGEAAMEELVVTGSYLKRSAADSPSPLSVVDAGEIEDSGAPDFAEIVQAMPWQSGSQSRTPSFSGDFNADGRVNINLRNLGHGSTLILVNGKRQVASWYNPIGNATVNVNALLPNIAIERVEIVKDGASALYGSDAIAGVVNFISKRDFAGFDFTYQFTTDDETSKGDTQMLDVIFGIQDDRGGIVAAASVMNRDPITIGDRYERYGGSTASGTGQPGRVIPRAETLTWASHGKTPGATVEGGFPRDPKGVKAFGLSDVNCEDAAAFDGQSGSLGIAFDRCAYDFGSFFNIVGEESLRKINVFGHYDYSDSVELYFEYAANNSEFDRFNSLNPNAPVRPLTVTRDENGDVDLIETHPGLVEDAWRRGIEAVDVQVVSRMLGGTVDLIGTDYRPLATFTDITRSDERMVIGAVWDFGMNSRNWTLDASFTASETDNTTTNVQDTRTDAMDAALMGLGGPACSPLDPNSEPGSGNRAWVETGDFGAGNCYWFNPFGNANFDRDGEYYGEGVRNELRNPKELYEWLLGRIVSAEEFRQRVIDVVATGDLMSLSNGPVGVALGYQRRSESGGFNYDAVTNNNNLDFAYGAQDWSGRLTTSAVFAEVAIPVASWMDLNLAMRYEDFDELGESTTDPKITAIFRPSDTFTVRASLSSSYRVPSLQQLFGALTTVANENDAGPALNSMQRDLAYRPAISGGNSELLPEEAEAFNVGFSWTPRNSGWEFSFDYYQYDYTNILTRENPSDVLLADNLRLEAWGKANQGEGNRRLAGVEALSGLTEAQFGDVQEVCRDQVCRNTTDGALLRIEPMFVNANSAEVSGFDFTISYGLSTRMGDMRFSVLGAWVMDFEIDVPGLFGGPGKVIDAVGSYNETAPVGPMPEFKLNSSFSWHLNQHRIYAILKHVDEVEYDRDITTFTSPRFWQQTIGIALGDAAADDFYVSTIDSMTTVDFHYTYSMGDLPFVKDARVTMGALNAFNEEPPWVPVNNAFDGTLHDPRGRIWFLRVGGSL